jgi:hypothetical protein
MKVPARSNEPGGEPMPELTQESIPEPVQKTAQEPAKEPKHESLRKADQTVRNIAIMGVMLAIIEAGKHALDFLPNVELVTLFFMLFTKHFGKKTYLVAVAFTLIETAIFGIHNWVIMYLYMWPLLITVVRLRKHHGEVTHGFCCILAGVFGLFFGALCSIPYWFIGGPSMAFTWWIAGIPYDIIHCVSNFLICLVLFRPVNSLMARAHNQGYL